MILYYTFCVLSFISVIIAFIGMTHHDSELSATLFFLTFGALALFMGIFASASYPEEERIKDLFKSCGQYGGRNNVKTRLQGHTCYQFVNETWKPIPKEISDDDDMVLIGVLSVL